MRLAFALLLAAACDREPAATPLVAPAASAPLTADTIFSSICARCHGADGLGGPPTDAGPGPRNFHDRRFQADRTDAQLKAVIVAGKSDDDALAIVAYLRSLPPVKSAVGHTTLQFPISMLVRATPRPVETPAPPPPADALARGRWLLQLGNCGSCHDAHDERHDPIAGKHFAGGDPFPMPGGCTLYAANISSDAATGIGAYTDEDLERVLTEGVNKAGRPLYYIPFTTLRNLTPEDRRALILALKQEPAVMNVVPPPPATAVTTARSP